MRQYQLTRWIRRCLIIIPVLWMIFTLVDFMGVRDHEKDRQEILRELHAQHHGGGKHGVKEERVVNKDNIDNLFGDLKEVDSQELGDKGPRGPEQIPLERVEGKERESEDLGKDDENGDEEEEKDKVVLNERGRRVHPETGLEYPDDETLRLARAKGQQLEKLVELGGTVVEKVSDTVFANVELPHFVDTKNPDGLGEGGKGVNVELGNLTPDEKTEYNKGWAANSFNQYLSDRISIHRSLPDGRSEACKKQALTYSSNQKEISVIIIFHNEAWSVLLRSVHSILSRTPEHLLREIILVDDFSTNDYLKKPLEKYFNSFPKVIIVRGSKRQGLTRARLLGFYVSTAPVLVFLDSHIECFPGWVEPLTARIGDNDKIVVFPSIEVISDENLEVVANSDPGQNGIFRWSDMTFQWQNIPDYEVERRTSNAVPIRSPTMPGGLFAISRNYFEKLGTYDPGLDYWGGENIELSFKAWMCGGSVEMVTCSHIGHIFRRSNPIHWTKSIGSKNSIRVAEVWMDDYKNYFYERILFNLGDYGDVSERQALRKKLNCRSFDWYLKNVYPNIVIPSNMKYAGEIRSQAAPKCIDSMGGPSQNQLAPKLYPCHGQGHNQFWYFNDDGHILVDQWFVCFDGKAIGTKSFCEPPGPHWQYREDKTIMHVPSGRCLTASLTNDTLTVQNCNDSAGQKWDMQLRRTDLVFPK